MHRSFRLIVALALLLFSTAVCAGDTSNLWRGTVETAPDNAIATARELPAQNL